MATPSVSPEDIRRLGPDVAAIKSRTDPRRWHALVQYAHSRGFGVGGVLSGVPDALKPRLQSSLVHQAKQTIATAYAPAEANLNTELGRLNAIGERRRTDAQAFNQWASTQRSALMTQAQAADDALAARKHDILAAAMSTMGAQQQAATQDASQQSGRVSDPHQSTALNYGDLAARTNGVLSAADIAQSLRPSSSDQMANANMAASGFAKMADAAREAAGQKDIMSVIGAQQDLGSARAKDYLSMLSGLQSAETDKASSNQDRLVAADKLNLQSRALDHTVLQDNRNFGLQSQKFNLDTWMAHHQNSVATAKVQLGYDQIASQEGRAAADRALRKQLGDQAHRDRVTKLAQGQTGSPADRKNSVNEASSVATISDEITRLHTKIPGSHIRNHLIGQGASSIQIDVANDLHTHGGKLSPRGRRKAKALGISTATMKHLGWIN